jgi:hypothetical protein
VRGFGSSHQCSNFLSVVRDRLFDVIFFFLLFCLGCYSNKCDFNMCDLKNNS